MYPGKDRTSQQFFRRIAKRCSTRWACILNYPCTVGLPDNIEHIIGQATQLGFTFQQLRFYLFTPDTFLLKAVIGSSEFGGALSNLPIQFTLGVLEGEFGLSC